MARSATARDAPGAGRATAIERYRSNWVHHLIGIADDLSRRVVDRLQSECGHEKIRLSLGPFISLVWREPRPLMELAQQLSISRQACSKVARRAEESGYVERVDGEGGDRAQRVRLTARGRELVEDSVRLIFEAESFYAAWIGTSRFRRFSTASSSLFFGLGLQDQTDGGFGEAARRSIAVLPIVAGRVEEDFHRAIRAKGHESLQLSHARLLARIGDEEMSVSEIARLQGVSRQATGATVHSLESLGYVRLAAHQTDGRAVRVRFAERGDELIRDSVDALDELEERVREMLGARAFADLTNIAAELHTLVALEEEISAAGDAGTQVVDFLSRPDRGLSDRQLQTVASVLERRLGETAARRLGQLLIGSKRAGQK